MTIGSAAYTFWSGTAQTQTTANNKTNNLIFLIIFFLRLKGFTAEKAPCG